MKLKKGKALDKKSKKTTKKLAKMKKKNIAEVSTDEFLNQDFENMDLSDSGGEIESKSKGTSGKLKSLRIEPNDDESSSSDELNPASHKKALNNLKEVDPEFFNYLKLNDAKLLDFNVDDEIDQLSSADESETRHVPEDFLEIPSDESDYEEAQEREECPGGPKKVTLKLIKKWQEEIQTDKSPKTIKCLIEAFHAALDFVSDSETPNTQYRVEGGPNFNTLIQTCIMLLPDAFKKFLKISDASSIEAHKSKRFPKIKGALRTYLLDLIRVIENVTAANIVTLLLRHLHEMLPYTKSYSSIRKPLLRLLLKHWSSSEDEKVRVTAFICIFKIAITQTALLETLLKTMYIKFVENSKFVSPTTLPGINFMKRSLTEMYLIDTNFSYTYAFIYVRQLAIHLRNALTLKKKEHFQAVYNWQFINSLGFWSELIAHSEKNSLLRHLLYPLVQINVGVINLIPTATYYPLRFHCVRMLIDISRETNTFIPSLPLIFQVLGDYDFNRKHTIVSMKPLSLMCMLRVSKSQQKESGFKDALIQNVYELILESAAKDSHAAYFPDMYFVCIHHLKKFLKKCHVANYCRKIKQLVDKIEENSKFIVIERGKKTFDFSNMPDIEAWEEQIKKKGTPCAKFYNSWIKVHEAQKLKLITQNDESADFKLPTKKKTKRPRFQRDSDEDSELEIPVEEMEKRLKKQKVKKKVEYIKSKKAKKSHDVELSTDNVDIVQDIKSGDWD